MKKAVVCLLGIFLLNSFTFAQRSRMQGSDSSNMECRHMGMGMIMPRVVSTLPDGSVLIMSGQKLIKYDQNLNLVKQVTVPVDSTTMQQMRNMCPNPPSQQRKTPSPSQPKKP